MVARHGASLVDSYYRLPLALREVSFQAYEVDLGLWRTQAVRDVQVEAVDSIEAGDLQHRSIRWSLSSGFTPHRRRSVRKTLKNTCHWQIDMTFGTFASLQICANCPHVNFDTEPVQIPRLQDQNVIHSRPVRSAPCFMTVSAAGRNPGPSLRRSRRSLRTYLRRQLYAAVQVVGQLPGLRRRQVRGQ